MNCDPCINGIDELFFFLAVNYVSLLPSSASIDKMKDLELVNEYKVIFNLLVESVDKFYKGL